MIHGLNNKPGQIQELLRRKHGSKKKTKLSSKYFNKIKNSTMMRRKFSLKRDIRQDSHKLKKIKFDEPDDISKDNTKSSIEKTEQIQSSKLKDNKIVKNSMQFEKKLDIKSKSIGTFDNYKRWPKKKDSNQKFIKKIIQKNPAHTLKRRSNIILQMTKEFKIHQI